MNIIHVVRFKKLKEYIKNRNEDSFFLKRSEIAKIVNVGEGDSLKKIFIILNEKPDLYNKEFEYEKISKTHFFKKKSFKEIKEVDIKEVIKQQSNTEGTIAKDIPKDIIVKKDIKKEIKEIDIKEIIKQQPNKKGIEDTIVNGAPKDTIVKKDIKKEIKEIDIKEIIKREFARREIKESINKAFLKETKENNIKEVSKKENKDTDIKEGHKKKPKKEIIEIDIKEIIKKGTKGPETKGPEIKGPEIKGPETKGPETKGPETKGPETKGPETKGPETKGPETKGPETKGPETNENSKKKEIKKDIKDNINTDNGSNNVIKKDFLGNNNINDTSHLDLISKLEKDEDILRKKTKLNLTIFRIENILKSIQSKSEEEYFFILENFEPEIALMKDFLETKAYKKTIKSKNKYLTILNDGISKLEYVFSCIRLYMVLRPIK